VVDLRKGIFINILIRLFNKETIPQVITLGFLYKVYNVFLLFL
jgi:hypothetical protein